jgi:hypothetical protein
MELVSPENFDEIIVSKVGAAPLGSRDNRTWGVAGITRFEKPGFIGEFTRTKVIKEGFANQQIAEAWMRRYLDEYISAAHFFTKIAWTTLDTDNSEG